MEIDRSRPPYAILPGKSEVWSEDIKVYLKYDQTLTVCVKGYDEGFRACDAVHAYYTDLDTNGVMNYDEAKLEIQYRDSSF